MEFVGSWGNYMVQISVSIVLYHNPINKVRRAIKSLLNTDVPIKLSLVDNSSHDELRTLADMDERIEYIFSSSNRGYSAGHNTAIRRNLHEGAKYHLAMNPDVYFERPTLETIYGYMEKNPDVGLLMPGILYPDGSVQHLCKILPTPFDVFSRRFLPFRKMVERRNNIYELRFTGYNKIMDVPYLSGCFMFMRTEAAGEIGFFDERFFMYFEDVDLSRRIHRRYRTVYYPGACVYHGFEKESYRNLKLLRDHIKSAIQYFNKWGWFFDKERDKINRETLERVSRKNPDEYPGGAQNR